MPFRKKSGGKKYRGWKKDALSEQDFVLWLAEQRRTAEGASDNHPCCASTSLSSDPLPDEESQRDLVEIQEFPEEPSHDNDRVCYDAPQSEELHDDDDFTVEAKEWDERFEKMCAHLIRCFPQGLDGIADNELFNRAQVNQFGWQWYHSTKLMIPLFFDEEAVEFPLKPRDSNVLSNPSLVHQRHIFLKYDLIGYIRKQFRHYIRRRGDTLANRTSNMKTEYSKEFINDSGFRKNQTSSDFSPKYAASNEHNSQMVEFNPRTVRKRRRLEHCYASSVTVERSSGDDNFYISLPSLDSHENDNMDSIEDRDASEDDNSVIFVETVSSETSKVSIYLLLFAKTI